MTNLMSPIGFVSGMSLYYVGYEENLPGNMRTWLDLIDPAGQHRCVRSLGKKTKFMKYEKHLVQGLEKLLRSVRKIEGS